MRTGAAPRSGARLRAGATLCAAVLFPACAAEPGGGEAAGSADPWLAPYAAAAGGNAWPATDVEVGVRIFQQDNRLRTFVPACRGAPADALPDSIGPLRPGQPLPEALAACEAVLRGWEWSDDGRARPTFAATIGGAIIVAAVSDTTVQATVGYLASGDAGTPEGFGAGSPIEDLITELGAPAFDAGGCTLEMRFDARPGLSFVLELPQDSDLECDDLEVIARDAAVDRVPSGTRVRFLVVQRR
jgi:hypothetical protein